MTVAVDRKVNGPEYNGDAELGVLPSVVYLTVSGLLIVTVTLSVKDPPDGSITGVAGAGGVTVPDPSITKTAMVWLLKIPDLYETALTVVFDLTVNGPVYDGE